ncbi:MAG: NADH-quinone oxidoreductase subunit C [Coriobacteriales bacterium]|nr:NADH-quinone oxidoreductase subunit C [Coriobacteriales bacterium]
MKIYHKVEFIDFNSEEILSIAKKACDNNLSFVQICASAFDNGDCELLYTFKENNQYNPALIGYKTIVEKQKSVHSITDYFPAAFVFENEAHDLFGVKFEGINIDFKGNFYKLPVAYPMNPNINVAEKFAEQGGQDE